MSKRKFNKKPVYCYLVCAIFLIFSIIMTIMSLIDNWNYWIPVYVSIAAIAMIYITFSKRVSEKVQSYFWVLAVMVNIFIYSYALQDLYATLIVLCAFAIITLIYLDAKLMVELLGLTFIMVLIHVLCLHTVDFSTPQAVLRFVVRMAALLFAECFLIFFTQYLMSVQEDLKESAEQAKRAEHSKSDFLANMSHEIRTPMNAIVGMCELILREDISEEVRENCFSIQNSGRSLLAIINDILDFSKIESGKAELIEDEFNIGSTINDVMNMAMTRKGEKKIDIIARIDPTIPKGLVGDEVRIKQIMINLVTNAIKFTNSGCVVLKITQSRHEYGINLNVSVKDTGIGITDENLEKLFTSFQQVDTKKNRSVEGTGLGLAISKRLVAKMGGFINVSSTYGTGSEFKFVIPLKVVDEEPFISVREKDKVKIAVYLDFEKYPHPRIGTEYTKLIREMSDKFHVHCDLFTDVNEFEEAVTKEKYTHCFTAREEYLEKRTLFDSLAEEMQMMIVQDRLNSVELPDNVKCIYKPFYALSVASALNNERYVFNLNERHDTIRFTAPNAKILIVDDNITNLKVAEGLMKPYNMKIMTAESGEEAIEKVKTQEFDIVFMDHMMPEMDGVEATAIIRAMEGEYFKNVPIIALTANAVNGARELFLESGLNDFVAKPIELSMLDRVLRSWLPADLIKSSTTTVNEEQQPKVEVVENDSFRKYVNAGKGLTYAGKNQEIYFQNLKTYMQNGRKQKVSLDNRFAEKDWSNYVIEVHALKSSSLSVGAEELSEFAKSLEFAGKEGKYELIVEKHEALSALFETVMDEIENYLTENGCMETMEAEVIPVTESEAITSEQFEVYMERIRTACENFDGDEMAAAAEELCRYSLNENELHTYFAEVKSLADDFEYDKALEVAENAAAKVR